MKKFKKYISVILSLTLLLSTLTLLTGCGSGTKEELNVSTGEMTKAAPESTAKAQATETTNAVTGEKKKIVIVEENTQTHVVGATKAAVDEFEKLGYKDGQTAEITVIHLDGDESKSADAVTKIKAMNPDVVLINNDRFSQTSVAKPLLDSGIPVIVKQMLEDTTLGLVDSIEKPGHNITGMVTMGSNLILPSYQLLNKIAPINGKKACFMTIADFSTLFSKEKVEAALKSMNIQLKEYKIVKDYEEMQQTFIKWNNDPEVGWSLLGVWPFVNKAKAAVDANTIMKWYRENVKKPGVTYWESVVSGAFPSGVAIDIVANGAQMADIAKEILDGKKPADIPVQEPNRTNIILNMAKIKELGLTVPNDLLGGSIIYKDYDGHKVGE